MEGKGQKLGAYGSLSRGPWEISDIGRYASQRGVGSQLAVGAGAGGAVFYQVVHYIVLLGEYLLENRHLQAATEICKSVFTRHLVCYC